MSDLIRREDVVDLINEAKNKFRFPNDALRYVENNIRTLPSAMGNMAVKHIILSNTKCMRCMQMTFAVTQRGEKNGND